MRRLVWFSVGFCGACFAALQMLLGWWLLAIAGVTLLAGCLLYFLDRTGSFRRILGMVLLGMAAGCVLCWGYDTAYLQTVRALDGQTQLLSIEITDYSSPYEDAVAADGKIRIGEKNIQIRCYLDTDRQLAPGDRLNGNFYLRYTGLGGQNGTTHHQGKGIMLLAYGQERVYIHQQDQVPARYFPVQLRRGVLELIDQLFPEDTVGFAQALLLGNSEKLSDQVDKAFQDSGIRHIIAVSGLHVSILISALYLVFGRNRYLVCIIGLPLLLLFAALAGFTPSVIRACVMQAIMLLSLLLKKEYDPPTSLAFAVIVILVANPFAVTTVGFQLSVGCVVGIFLVTERLYKHLLSKLPKSLQKGKTRRAGFVRGAIQSVWVSVGAMSLTTPLSACYFGSISLVGILGNLLTMWVITFIFCGIILACIAGWLIPALGTVIAGVISWPMRYVVAVSSLLSKIPFCCASTDSIYVNCWLVFAYGMVAVFLAIKPRKLLPMVISVLSSLALCLSLLVLEGYTDHYRVTVLDVGQGQCVILRSRQHCYIVDCGGDYGAFPASQAVRQLQSQGVTRLDGLILTHYDMDHAGYAESLLAQLPTDAVYIPDAPDHNGIRTQLEENYPEKLTFVLEDTFLPCGLGEITIFPAKLGQEGNASSLCILFQVENCDILITGDRSSQEELELVESAELPELEVLIAGHHGSESSTSMWLLDETRPEVAVISVGAGNTYGHPAQETLERLKLFGCRILRTDQNGTITFRG